jgi:hypothetical protein
MRPNLAACQNTDFFGLELGERDRLSPTYLELRRCVTLLQKDLELAITVDQSARRFPITFAVIADKRPDTVTGDSDERARPFRDRLKFFKLGCSDVGNQIAESVHIDNFPQQRSRFPTRFTDRKRPNVVDHRTEHRYRLIFRQPRCRRCKEVSAVEGRAD